MSPNFLSSINFYHFNKHRNILSLRNSLLNNPVFESLFFHKNYSESLKNCEAGGEKVPLGKFKTETSAIHLNSTLNKSVFNVSLLISNACCSPKNFLVFKRYKLLPSFQVTVCFEQLNREYHSAVFLPVASYISAEYKVLLRKSTKSFYIWENLFNYRSYFVNSVMMVWATECDPNVCFILILLDNINVFNRFIILYFG